MEGKDLNFQTYNATLAGKLEDAFSDKEIMVCIPYALARFSGLKSMEISFWKNHLYYFRLAWFSRIDFSREYGDTWISRFYSPYIKNEQINQILSVYRDLWKSRDVILIEGEFSRLGVGNSLFKGAKTIQRILCPSKNAFDAYDTILKTAKACNLSALYILALGPTATALARDLYYTGRQALDLGHIDLEYVWCKTHAAKKVPVPGKFSNEAFLNKLQKREVEGSLNPEDMAEYTKQIIAKVCI